jgi:hypothetical protein
MGIPTSEHADDCAWPAAKERCDARRPQAYPTVNGFTPTDRLM